MQFVQAAKSNWQSSRVMERCIGVLLLGLCVALVGLCFMQVAIGGSSKAAALGIMLAAASLGSIFTR